MKETTSSIESREELINLRHVWHSVMLQKWKIALFSLIVTLLTALWVFTMEPVYQASATVLVENQESKVLSIDDVYKVNTGNDEYLKTQFEILKSRELATKVVKKLKLDKHPLFDPRLQQEQSFIWKFLPSAEQDGEAVDSGNSTYSEDEILDEVVTQFFQGLTITPVRETQLVTIQYESTDARLAAKIANTLAETYIESHLEAKLKVTRKASTWLSDRLGNLQKTLQDSEEKLQAYRDEAQLIDVEGVMTMDAEEFEQLTQRYVDATRVRSEAETIYHQIIRPNESTTAEQLLSMSAVLSHPLIQGLKTSHAAAAQKVAELSKRYGPKHPKMIAARSEVDQAMDELSRQALRIGHGIASEYQMAKNTEASIKAQLTEAKKRLQDVNRKEFRLLGLEREVEANRELYDMFLTRAKETEEAGDLQAAHARVVDPAVTPRWPIKPKKKLILLLALMASGMLGAIIAIFTDAMNNTIRTPDDVEEKLQVSMLGFLPAVKNNKSQQAFEGFLSNTHSNFAEAIRTIRTGLMLSGLDDTHKLTLITSSVPDEGKSTVALNLAEALGQMERVLLIDADMRRPTLAKTMGLSRSAPGLSNLVAGTAEFNECVHTLGSTSVDVITAGIIPSNPLELLASKRFGEVLSQLKKRYNRIIIDSAPTHAVSDATVLASYADSIVYVVKADDTAAPLAAKGIKRLKEIGAPITGVVLNKVDVSKHGRYSFYAGYYQNYGYAGTNIKDLATARSAA